jgi:hypothetical protein
MFIDNYKIVIKNFLIADTNLYNIPRVIHELSILRSVFSTFGSGKSTGLVRLYSLLFRLTNQRPFLKRVRLSYIKKKILYRFFICLNLNSRNARNFFFYFVEFYLYFFNIFFLRNLNFSFNCSRFVYYLDNFQYFVKNYGKHNQRTRLELSVKFDSITSFNCYFKHLASLFVLRLRGCDI